jgi:hypothetical protein
VTVPREEVEQAFQAHWTTGALEERWDRWPDHLTEDVEYVEHVYGHMRGREPVRAWITALMEQRADVHAVLDWYLVQDEKVVLSMWNRLYSPDPEGAPFDFAGMTVLDYGGDGLFRRQEDYWCVRTSKTAFAGWLAAVEAHGGRGLSGGRFEHLEAERRADTLAVFARGGRPVPGLPGS